MCIARLSNTLLDDINAFYKKLKSNLMFFEWVWPTVAKMNHRRHVLFRSSYFKWRPCLDASFRGYEYGCVYHPAKQDLSWESV